MLNYIDEFHQLDCTDEEAMVAFFHHLPSPPEYSREMVDQVNAIFRENHIDLSTVHPALIPVVMARILLRDKKLRLKSKDICRILFFREWKELLMNNGDEPYTPSKPDHIYPPWSADQIRALEAHQHDERFHPYTCGNDHPGDRMLIPTVNGWICPGCHYTQGWAHGPFRTTGSPVHQ